MSGQFTNTYKKSAIKYLLDGSDPLTGVTTFYLSLHTADPITSGAGSQDTSETTYTGYARVSILRNISDWDDLTAGVENAVKRTFGTNTAGTPTLTHFGIGLSSTGAGTLLFSGTITPNVTLAVSDVPAFNIGDLEVKA